MKQLILFLICSVLVPTTTLAQSQIYDMTDIWNDGGTDFSAIKMDVTDTASGTNSKLLDLQIGGSSKFNVSKSGALIIDTSDTTAAAPLTVKTGATVSLHRGYGLFACDKRTQSLARYRL